jgi:CRP/FNR family transcriptional regulator, cyclic AMP receptor protein
MGGTENTAFNTVSFLAIPGPGRRLAQFKTKQILFSQGGVAEAVFYLRSGRAKLTVVSKRGKEATITLLAAGDFVGEESIAGTAEHHKATARAISTCVAMRITREHMLEVLHKEREFSDFFVKFMLTRSMRTQADLIDQLFNSSERRLARTLLLMAEFGAAGEPATMIPAVSQETLAEMIGTTRSRVSFFMNRFRKLGYIDYNGRIHVDKSLMKVVLQDELPGENASRPHIPDPPTDKAKGGRRPKLD